MPGAPKPKAEAPSKDIVVAIAISDEESDTPPKKVCPARTDPKGAALAVLEAVQQRKKSGWNAKEEKEEKKKKEAEQAKAFKAKAAAEKAKAAAAEKAKAKAKAKPKAKAKAKAKAKSAVKVHAPAATPAIVESKPHWKPPWREMQWSRTTARG